MSANGLEIADLDVVYRRSRGAPLHAVDGVSLTVPPGRTVGLVGESGSGKSTVGRAVLGLTPVTAGTIRLGGQDITRIDQRRRRHVARQLTVVFQDPYSSLNPARRIGETLADPLLVGGRTSRADARARVVASLQRVGMPAEAADRYPRQFSGGQRQRIAIARALVVDPQLVICDEAVSALDLSIQAQVLNLLRELQAGSGIGLLFITHDLSVVRHVSEDVVVLLRGRVMESGPTAQVHGNPRHPYTRALLAAAPVPDPSEQARRRAERALLTTPVADVARPVHELGCPFVSRCPHRMDRCVTERPVPVAVGGGVTVACHLFGPNGAGPAGGHHAG